MRSKAKSLILWAMALLCGIGSVREIALGQTGARAAFKPAASNAELRISTSGLRFDDTAVGSSTSQRIKIAAVNGPVTIRNLKLNGSDYYASGLDAPVTLSPGEVRSLTVTFAPNQTGPEKAILLLESDANNGLLSVPIAGKAVMVPEHSATLEWNETGDDADGYNVYRTLRSGGPYTKLNTAALAQPSYEDIKVAPGQTYFYVITSVAGATESSVSSEIKATIPTQ